MTVEHVVSIRPATPADAPPFATLSGQLGYPSSLEQSHQRLAGILAARDHAVMVACLGARVVGWVHVFVTRRVESDPFAELGGLVVDEGCRRRGIGKRLVVAAQEWARSHGVARLRVRSRSDRQGAGAFYSSLGFSATKEQRVFDKTLDRESR